MGSFLNLPTTLVALLLALPVFSIPSTPNDPFYSISIHVVRFDPPVCCLVNLPPLEPFVEEDVLVSFEEWKSKQAAIKEKEKEKGVERNASSGNQLPAGGGTETGAVAEEGAVVQSEATESSIPTVTETQTIEKVSPHFQVPLTDRFNYASTDCSARVHISHRSAKSPSAILSSKKDRYMLSPCDTPNEKQFVVVELCEDIRIDTVQLANFEFFSGVFKDFTVSVSKTYTTSQEGWVHAGTYRAKNVRGVQSFHPPTSLRDFYRFIRIDFETHYSNEFYCPISLLRVYGLTHLEEWKWEIWEAESQAKREELEARPPPSEVVEDDPQPVDTPPSEVSAGTSTTQVESIVVTSVGMTKSINIPPPVESTSIHQHSAPAASGSSTSDSVSLSTTPSASAPLTTATTTTADAATNTKSNETHARSSIPSVNSVPEKPSDVTIPATESANPDKPNSNATSQSSTSLISSGQASATLLTSTTTITASPSSSHVATYSIPPPPSGGESIYRTIMNRLAALETNHTLYARYFEEQTIGVREMLKKLGEDVGRLEGIEKAQAKAYQRHSIEWEKQRCRMEREYYELLSRVDYLSDEITLEKRLGIAQLCLLLTVLVFMGLTRGSRGESFMDHGPVRMREWGRRHLSLSGDWVSKLSLSKSRSPTRTIKSPRVPSKGLHEAPSIAKASEEPTQIAFPSMISLSRPPKTAPPGVTKTPVERRVVIHKRSQSRTPSLRNTPSRPSGTPTTARPPHTAFIPRPRLQRANSHGSSTLFTATISASNSWSGGVVGPVPRSAKRWARTAHLHEVKSEKLKRKDVNGHDVDDADTDADGTSISSSSSVQHSNRTRRKIQTEVLVDHLNVADVNGDGDVDNVFSTPSHHDPGGYSLFLSNPPESKKFKKPTGVGDDMRSERWPPHVVDIGVVDDGDLWVDTDASVENEVSAFGDEENEKSDFNES